MHRVNFRVALAFRKVQFATLECIGVCRIRKARLYLFGSKTSELFQKLRAAIAHKTGEIGLVVCEVCERCGGGEFLPLKKHGRSRRKQHERSHGSIPSGRSHLMTAFAACRVGYLIMVLNECNELLRLYIECRRAAPLPLPFVSLALIQIAILDRRHEFLRLAQIIRVVGFVAARQRNQRTVMKIIVPQVVYSITALLCRSNKYSML